MAQAQADDARFLRRAVELSAIHMRANEGGPFGALIVGGGEVVAEGHNRVTAGNDPTAHAEVMAIREACARLGTFDLTGHTLYSSCEPCPMCLAATYWARLDRLVFATSRADAMAYGFSDKRIYDEIAKSAEARDLPTRYLPLPEALEVFREWQEKPDKLLY